MVEKSLSWIPQGTSLHGDEKCRAQVTDVAIIVVAAGEVMPQTKKQFLMLSGLGVPMIIAINKVDKPAAPIQTKSENNFHC